MKVAVLIQIIILKSRVYLLLFKPKTSIFYQVINCF